MLSVYLLIDWTHSLKLAVLSVRKWLVMWFIPAELTLIVPMGFLPSNSRYTCSSSWFVKAWSAFSDFNFLNYHRRVELFRPSIQRVTTNCLGKWRWLRYTLRAEVECRKETWQCLVQLLPGGLQSSFQNFYVCCAILGESVHHTVITVLRIFGECCKEMKCIAF